MEKAVQIASTFEKEGKIQLAIYELQKALQQNSLNQSKEEEQKVQEKLRELMLTSSNHQNSKGAAFLESLLKNLEAEDSAIVSESAFKLLIFLKEQEFLHNRAATIAETVLNAYEKADLTSEIRATFLYILSNLTHSDIKMRELICSGKSSILSLDKINDNLPLNIAAASLDLLISLIQKEAEKEVDFLNIAIHILHKYLDIFGFVRLEPVSKKLPLIFKNRTFADSFLRNKFDFLARMATDHANRLMLKQCLAVILNFYDSKNDNEISFIREKLSNVILYKYDIGYLWLLMCLCESAPKLIPYFFSKNNLLNNLIDLLEVEKDILPIISTLSLAVGSSEVRVQLSNESLKTLKSVQLDSISDKDIKMSYILTLIKCCSNEYLDDGKIITIVIDDFCNGDIYHSVLLKYLEALTYLSTRGVAKEKICERFSVICERFSFIKKSLNSTADFAILSILYNLTLYPQILSEEEQQVKKLQELTNMASSKDPYNSRQFVSKRVEKMVGNSNFIGLLCSLRSSTVHSMKLLSSIYLSIATDQKLRGKLVQAGSCKILIALANNIEKGEGLDAAQALAKIAITSNPALAFKGELSIDIIRPLMGLLRHGNLLCQFESLMALTNLAGYSDLAREKIVSGGLEVILDLQFSNNKMVRRAATEALCNLVFHDAVFSLVTVENSQLLALMVALSDDEDFGTSRAASGFIAIISAEKAIISNILEQKRFIEIFESLLVRDNPEIQHRAIETVKNIVTAGYSSKITKLISIGRNLKSSSIPAIANIAQKL